VLLGAGPQTFTWWGTWFTINIVVISNIFWPGESLHGQSLGLFYWLGLILMSFSRLLLGILSDKLSRVKLMTAITIIDGILFVMYGFVPVEFRDTSFVFFLAICLIRSIATGGSATDQNSPVLMSFADDSVAEEKRSQFFGAIILVQQLVSIVGGIIAAVVFQQFWRQYFWIVGIIITCTGLVIPFKLKEPKRGAEKAELRNILKLATVAYRYQLTRETSSTLASPSNIAILIEGIFTQIIQAVPYLLLFAYAQSEPYNLSPISMSLIAVLFGIPGALLGGIVFAKMSDRYAKKGIKNRIHVILLSLLVSYAIWFVLFLLPLPHLSKDEGNNLAVIFSFFGFWGVAICIFFGNAIGNVFAVNQRPILQKINLPEAQGLISSANVLLESLGRGIGMILSGFFLDFFHGNYVTTVFLFVIMGSFGSVLWLLAMKWIDKDVAKLSGILNARAEKLSEGGKP
jgi:MFS family permease